MFLHCILSGFDLSCHGCEGGGGVVGLLMGLVVPGS